LGVSYRENSHVKTLGRRKTNWLLAYLHNGEAEDIIASTYTVSIFTQQGCNTILGQTKIYR